MGYRDEFQAAVVRADALAQQLAQTAASNQASARETEALREQLAACHSEIDRLRSLIPGERATLTFAPIRYALVAGVALLPATAMAGAARETFGISMSYLAVAPFAFAIGAKLGSRHSREAAYTAGVIAIPIGLALLFAFYQGIWPSL